MLVVVFTQRDPEGQDLASAGNDGLVKIWATASEEELAVLTERNKVDKPKGGLQTRSEIRQYILNDEDADGSITFMREREKAIAEQERQVLESTREIENNPKSATAFNLRGNAYTNLGEFARAIADYDNAVALAPDDVIILGNRAYALVAKGDFDLAIADCNRAIQTDAKFGFAWFWRGAAN